MFILDRLNPDLAKATKNLRESTLNEEHTALIDAELALHEAVIGSDLDADTMDALLGAIPGMLSEATIVRLDADAKMQRAYKIGILSLARQNGDTNFKKLQTVHGMKDVLWEKIEAKWGVASKKLVMKRAKDGEFKKNYKPKKK